MAVRQDGSEKTEMQRLKEERGESFEVAFAWSVKEWLITHMIDGVKMKSLEEGLVSYLSKVFKIAPLVCLELVKTVTNERIFQTLTKTHSAYCTLGVKDLLIMPHEASILSPRKFTGLDWLNE